MAESQDDRVPSSSANAADASVEEFSAAG